MIRLNKVEWVLKHGWQLAAALSCAMIGLGILAISASFSATLTTVFILGGVLLVGGILHAIHAISARAQGRFLGHVLAGVLYAVAGGFMMLHPIAGAATLTLLIGMLLIIGGLYEVFSSLALRYKNWGWECFGGAVSLSLGISIFAQWPFASFWLIGTFVGIDLVFRGWSALLIALAARSVSTSIEERIRGGLEERRGGPMDRRVAAVA